MNSIWIRSELELTPLIFMHEIPNILIVDFIRSISIALPIARCFIDKYTHKMPNIPIFAQPEEWQILLEDINAYTLETAHFSQTVVR
jgi:hypothetical protein